MIDFDLIINCYVYGPHRASKSLNPKLVQFREISIYISPALSSPGGLALQIYERYWIVLLHYNFVTLRETCLLLMQVMQLTIHHHSIISH